MNSERTSEGAFQIDIEQLFRFIYDLISNSDGSGIIVFLQETWGFLNFISIFLAPLLFFGIVYSVVRLHQIHGEEHQRFEEAVRKAGSTEKGDERWRRIMNLVNGDNPIEWRQAIIEADVILDELLKGLGYIGDTLGDRLKVARQENFKKIDEAWDAHLVRNQIAHSGSDFILTQREARRAIDNFRQVFSEANSL